MTGSPQIREQIGRGLECAGVQILPPDPPLDWPEEPPTVLRRQRSYLDFLAREQPYEKGAIEAAKACFEGENRHACLKKLIHGEKSLVPEYHLGLLSGAARYYCMKLNEAARKNEGDGLSFIAKEQPTLAGILENETFKDLSSAEVDFLSEYVHFHYRQGPDWLAPTLSHLRKPVGAEQGLEAYASRPTATQPIQPALCANDEDYLRVDLSIPGLSRALPFFVAKEDRVPWWLYRDFLTAQFEVLKTRIVLGDMERILAPSHSPTLSFLLATRWQKRKEFFAKCGIDGGSKSGFYSDHSHRIGLLNLPWLIRDARLPNGANLGAIADDPASTLYHEMAHAIDRLFLNEKSRKVLDSVFEWMEREYPARPKLVPIPEHWIGGKPYAMKNRKELFAQWVAEFFSVQASGIAPSDPALRARISIMEAFFTPQGIDPEAWTVAKVEAAFRAQGIEMKLTKSGFSLPLAVGFEYLSLPYRDGRATTISPRAGIGFGYYNGAPLGFRYGGGAQFDLSLVDGGHHSRADGNRSPVAMRVFDTGAFAYLGYVFPHLETALEPAIGWRHFQVGEESGNQVWLGGSALVGLSRYGVSLGFDARVSPDGGYSLGGNVRLDILRAIEVTE